jgi:hypothetical protein
VAGMAIGTVFTLFVVPVFYALIAREHAPEPALESAERHRALPLTGMEELANA